MTQEEKYILLKYLCMALPYGVKCQLKDEVRVTDGESNPFYDYALSTRHLELFINHTNFHIKPYLRPMSSMTDVEIKIERNIQQDCLFGRKPLIILTDFYYSRHLDVNGLIEKGLALEAPEGMYIKKEK